ncbi:hypothetical protein PtA15_6A743 [Puccinia triticina]|uniref:GTP cyclohydrolase II n=1 Tax=Puccinia triticina TaxID=208348 RepID=A0ABY7CP40_9BASI|nr:uncharacterized protein PtA15_6A743 [Puccinia triticina]WAQ86113.1 hypothetical protein PtA15_6A743 [Puccinia triticina]WAR55999.1 hypothetical protein PtB15_6B743 [Puccinia triticina]
MINKVLVAFSPPGPHFSLVTPADLNILSLLTKTPQGKFNDRRPRLDPLILETAALSSPAQTRNHYLHSYHAQHQPQQKQHHQCEARTRIPTGEGQLWLHLYTNSLDAKEHLAFVIDQAQMHAYPAAPADARWIRSRSLDAVWGPEETETERLVRGAYPQEDDEEEEKPIVRIHSECFTGETIGSQRCDCGEQLADSLRHIFTTPPYRGAVIYLRQEGRGIGLLNKIKAYNLQELGFDTLESNLLLGFGPDLRDYSVAARILEDLDLRDIRLMTNNPGKIEALTRSSHDPIIHVRERIPMVPSHWRAAAGPGAGASSPEAFARMSRACQHQGEPLVDPTTHPQEKPAAARPGSELDIYLRTKVTRMPGGPGCQPSAAPPGAEEAASNHQKVKMADQQQLSLLELLHLNFTPKPTLQPAE